MLISINFTFKIFGLMGFGPLDEKSATVGDIKSLSVSVVRIVAVGELCKKLLGQNSSDFMLNY